MSAFWLLESSAVRTWRPAAEASSHPSSRRAGGSSRSALTKGRSYWLLNTDGKRGSSTDLPVGPRGCETCKAHTVQSALMLLHLGLIKNCQSNSKLLTCAVTMTAVVLGERLASLHGDAATRRAPDGPCRVEVTFGHWVSPSSFFS